MDNISPHITYKEATESPKAKALEIDNTPSFQVMRNMEMVAKACFEPLREWYGKPIKINSFYRCYELNITVGGSKTSDHMQGRAIDITAGSRSENKKLFDWCKANLKFDQLIYEYGDDNGPDWVHISFNIGKNRNQTIIKK